MRQDSVRAGLEALVAAKPTKVLIHDAARPFVDASLIDRVIGCLATHDAALPSLPVTDTIKRANDGHVTETLKREGLWRAQTPQGFKFDAILAAHRKAAEAGRNDFTDDSAVAEWFGLDVGLVEGSEANRKLTSAEDLRSADEALRSTQGPSGTMRVASGYDVHAFAPGDAVILCGVRIPHGKKLSGHSDADVALHALTDALLGVIADGDIGAHFPPSDERWRGQASSLFLKEAGSRVKARGGRIVHADITLDLRSPAHRALSRCDAGQCRGRAWARARPSQRQGDDERGSRLYRPGRRDRGHGDGDRAAAMSDGLDIDEVLIAQAAGASDRSSRAWHHHRHRRVLHGWSCLRPRSRRCRVPRTCSSGDL